MPTKAPIKVKHRRRILGRVTRAEFFGRADALDEILRHAERIASPRGLLLLTAPSAGASELLRQAYDEIFQRHEDVIPIYFELNGDATSSTGTARQFLYTFLKQVVAFRRRDPALSNSALTVTELYELTPASDFEWVENLIQACDREEQSGDERAFIRLCLSVPGRAALRGARTVVMIDGLHIAEQLTGEVSLGTEIAHVFSRAESPFVLAGLRRRVLDLVHGERGSFDSAASVHLQHLSDEDARSMVENLAEKTGTDINDQTRDLIVQQFGGNPSFISSMIRAAQEKRLPLNSFRSCQMLYVDEVMGGRFNRHCAAILDAIAPDGKTRNALIRVLYEAVMSDSVKSPVESWRKKLGMDSAHVQEIMGGLHVHELVSVNASVVQKIRLPYVWDDYLHAHYRLEI